MAVNMDGALLVTRACVPHMARGRRDREPVVVRGSSPSIRLARWSRKLERYQCYPNNSTTDLFGVYGNCVTSYHLIIF